MVKASVFDLKAKLSDYLDRAARGEHIMVCRHNKPVAELRPVEAARTAPRPVGPLPGRPTFDIPASFFDPMPDTELGVWEGLSPADPLTRAWTPRPRRKALRAAKAKATSAAKPTARGASAKARRPVRRRP